SDLVRGTLAERDTILEAWLAQHAEGTACVIGDASFGGTPRVRSLTPTLAKGLEFDLVILVDPDTWGGGIEGAVDRYVAMTRATQQLVVLRFGALAARDPLDVVPREVVQPRDGWNLADGGMGPVLIVEVQPVRECCSAG